MDYTSRDHRVTKHRQAVDSFMALRITACLRLTHIC